MRKVAWDHKLKLGDVFHNDELGFEERRDIIVKRIRAAPFFDEGDWELVGIAEALAESEYEDEFDFNWNEFYDWCDLNKRVWVDTFAP